MVLVVVVGLGCATGCDDRRECTLNDRLLAIQFGTKTIQIGGSSNGETFGDIPSD
jgi:hypothetical protein